ncbi:MAG: hypothetical protein MUF27_11085 [Acidobacteria bacterium]|jgi:hypothetical protein|nr:hypothetical protein [Acidobacteriota bacterium]
MAGSRGAADRLVGLLLFLPVPVVLWLFTRAPLGVGPSLALGVALMLTHRLYARTWALARADRRCLWCGAAAGDGAHRVEVVEPQDRTAWRACSARHADRLRRTLGWIARHRLPVLAGIGGAILLLALGGPLAARGWLGPVSFEDLSHTFRALVALTVLPLALIGPFSRDPGPEPPRLPFPVHIQSLIGTSAVMWLFRVVGAIWLAQGLVYWIGKTAGGR